MIFITGDTHADFKHRFNTENFPVQKEMTKDDYVIICGDFGGIWRQKEDKNEKYWLDWFDNRNYTLLFIDGNHENYDRLNSYPVKEWKGGKVHQIRPNVLHLMRGEIFNLDGIKVFAFGGARCHDIPNGILEPDDKKIFKWQHDWSKLFRINHISWWKEEMPSPDEMEYAWNNLKAHNFDVDIILTHDIPTSVMPFGMRMDNLNEFLELIRVRTKFALWCNGHYHRDISINPQHTMLYNKILYLGDYFKERKDALKPQLVFDDVEFDKSYYTNLQKEEMEEIQSRSEDEQQFEKE